METTILLPSRHDKKTIAELSIFILSHEWPLPLKTIQRKLQKEHGKQASFQATHKALNNLIMKQILVKQNLQYELNSEWLKQLEKFSAETRIAYETKKLQPNS